MNRGAVRWLSLEVPVDHFRNQETRTLVNRHIIGNESRIRTGGSVRTVRFITIVSEDRSMVTNGQAENWGSVKQEGISSTETGS